MSDNSIPFPPDCRVQDANLQVERDRQIRRYAELLEKRKQDEVSGQTVQKPKSGPKGGRPVETASVIAKETGLSDDTVRRAPPRQPTKQERWRERNPLKAWAHMATRSAVRRGLIHKRPCQACGNPDAEAHHPDYRAPLRVIWWCRPCHKLHHAGRLHLDTGTVPTGDLFAGGAM